MEKPNKTNFTIQESLSNLLVDLHDHGFDIGIDDAKRIGLAFQHSKEWDRAKKLRVLKSLIVRNEKEQQAFESIQETLFPEQVLVKAPQQQRQTEVVLKPYISTHSHRDTVLSLFGEVFTHILPYALLWFLILGIPLYIPSEWLAGPSPSRQVDAGTPPEKRITEKKPTPTIEPGTEKSISLSSGRQPDKEIRFEATVVRIWWLVLFLGLAFFFGLAAWYLQHQLKKYTPSKEKLTELVTSTGPKTYQIGEFSVFKANPIDDIPIREAAFLLHRPNKEGDSERIDVKKTIEETIDHVGLLQLQFKAAKEHGDIVFIEDINPSMAKWPFHGQQIVKALKAQGATVIHMYTDSAPSTLYTDRGLVRSQTLEQVLSQASSPTTIVFSDASWLRPLSLRQHNQNAWLSHISKGVWLNPSPRYHWGDGAFALAKYTHMIDITSEDMLRITSPHIKAKANNERWFWLPPRSKENTQDEIKDWKKALGDRTFEWLLGGAFLANLSALQTKLWWQMRKDLFPTTPLYAIERVWEIPGLAVGSDGSVMLPQAFQDDLLYHLRTERKGLLHYLSTWLRTIIEQDQKELQTLEKQYGYNLAIHNLKLTKARLYALAPVEDTQEKDAFEELINDGFGVQLAAESTDYERRELHLTHAIKVDNHRNFVEKARKTFVVAAVLCFGLFGWTYFDRSQISIKKSFVLMASHIPSGTFSMGSPTTEPGRSEDESPQRKVRLTRGYWMSKAEITQNEFSSVMGYNPSKFQLNGENRPVENVNWHEAAHFSNKISKLKGLASCYSCKGTRDNVRCEVKKEYAGKQYYNCPGWRIPTEAEWERAYRAGTTTAFYNGKITKVKGKDSKLDAIGWYRDNSKSSPQPVMKKLPNDWGLYDMAGNVFEWCFDTYTPYKSNDTKNPIAESSKDRQRVIRGGSFMYQAKMARAAFRARARPSERSFLTGFRLVKNSSAKSASLIAKSVYIPKGTATVINAKGPNTATEIRQGYWMWQTEVTQREFFSVMRYNPSKFKKCGLNCPVESVSWHEAALFTNKLSKSKSLDACYICKGTGKKTNCSVKEKYEGQNYRSCPGWRLPTKAEWLFASRIFQKGPHIITWKEKSREGWFKDNSGGRTHAVMQKKPNGWSLYDMRGNVCEWIQTFQPKRTLRKIQRCQGTSGDSERVLHSSFSISEGFTSAFAGFRPVRTDSPNPIIPKGIQELITKLQSSDLQTTFIAMSDLGRMGQKASPALPYLRKLLQNSSAFLRLVAAITIFNIRVPPDASKKQLLEQLKSKDSEERDAALYKLAEEYKRDERVIKLVQARFGAARWMRRLASVTSIMYVDEPLSKDLLTKLLQEKDPSVLLYTLIAIYMTYDFSTHQSLSIKQLIPFLDHARWEIKSVTMQILRNSEKAPTSELPKYISLLNDTSGSFISEKHADVVIPVKVAAITLIGSLGSKAIPALNHLLPLLKDKHWRVRAVVAEAIGKIGSKAISALLHLIPLLADENTSVRSSATTAIKNMGSKVLIHLVPYLKNKDWRIRFGVSKIVGDMGGKALPIIPFLEMRSNDPDPRVRISVRKAIKRIRRLSSKQHFVGSRQRPAHSCSELKGRPSGQYWILLPNGKTRLFYCELKRNGGGWLRISSGDFYSSNPHAGRALTFNGHGLPFREIWLEHKSGKIQCNTSSPFTNVWSSCNGDSKGTCGFVVFNGRSVIYDAGNYKSCRNNRSIRILGQAPFGNRILHSSKTLHLYKGAWLNYWENIKKSTLQDNGGRHYIDLWIRGK